MLKKAVPQDPRDWDNIVEGSELPHPKVMMSTAQLIGGVSAKDPDNMLIDVMDRKYNDAQTILYDM